MSYIDIKYISLASPGLLKFEKKKEGLYNFRCPYCGDSKKKKNKARGYIFKVKNDFVYKCHNCGVGRTFTNFLKDQNKLLHDQYIMERYSVGLTGKGTTTPDPVILDSKPVFKKKDITIDLPKISDLNISHPARDYLQKRQIKDLDLFYYCHQFKHWVNTVKHTYKDLRGKDEPRIILPLYTIDNKLFGFQGRSLATNPSMRYITIILDDTHPKLYGLERINRLQPVYVTEGPFDSTFLRNSIAMCGSDVHLDSVGIGSPVWVYDNEPRNTEIVKHIETTISSQQAVVIWPSNIVEKDINDMVLAGHDVQSIVECNTFRGLEAKLKFNSWKKV